MLPVSFSQGGRWRWGRNELCKAEISPQPTFTLKRPLGFSFSFLLSFPCHRSCLFAPPRRPIKERFIRSPPLFSLRPSPSDTCSCPAAFAETEEVAARLPPVCPWQVTQPPNADSVRGFIFPAQIGKCHTAAASDKVATFTPSTPNPHSCRRAVRSPSAGKDRQAEGSVLIFLCRRPVWSGPVAPVAR